MTLNQRIQQFYDHSTQLWLDVWGEHMHHGHYGTMGTERKDNLQAQIDLIEEVLHWGKIESAKRILDVGCGVGGSARLLASWFDAKVLGLTLSPVQAINAEILTKQSKLEEWVQFRVQDVMELNEPEASFDLIWSLESVEHITDKKGLLELFFKLLEPGGKFIIVTWCHRQLPPPLTARENNLLKVISDMYHISPMTPLDYYEQVIKEVGFTQIQTADWSQAVQPFWGAVIQSALSWRSIKGLIRSGMPTIKGAYAMRYMREGFRKGIIKYVVIQAQKP